MESELKAVKQSEKGISFPLSSSAHQIIEQSAELAERAKKREAKLRLEDHCRRFPNWRP